LSNADKDEKTYNFLRSVKKGDRDIWIGIIRTLITYGNTDEEVTQSILKYNTCGFDDPVKTLDMVIELKDDNGKLNNHERRIYNTSELSNVTPIFFKNSLDYLLYFVQYYGIPKENIPNNPLEAVFYHINRGRIVLPRYQETKQVYLNHRSSGKDRFKWKFGGVDYSKLIMRPEDVYSCWDFSSGLCLIVPTDWRNDCYLDIDMKSDKHPDGLDKMDESILKGFHYERTKNGGYHVFGKGRPQKPPNPHEMQLVSTLIVTYPTKGYMIN
jgi:hypothetical protein